MQGPEGAAARAAGWLTARIPARLRLLETRLGLEANSLANPAQVLDHERGPIAVEDWPAVYVLPLRLEGLTLVDVEEDAGETYRATYALRVLAWVRADSYATTDALRKRYALAIREALLERKALKVAESTYVGDPDADLAVNPDSIREDYSDVLVDDAKRTIAGVDVTVTVTVTERIAGPAGLGSANALEVTELPPHPALS